MLVAIEVQGVVFRLYVKQNLFDSSSSSFGFLFISFGGSAMNSGNLPRVGHAPVLDGYEGLKALSCSAC